MYILYRVIIYNILPLYMLYMWGYIAIYRVYMSVQTVQSVRLTH